MDADTVSTVIASTASDKVIPKYQEPKKPVSDAQTEYDELLIEMFNSEFINFSNLSDDDLLNHAHKFKRDADMSNLFKEGWLPIDCAEHLACALNHSMFDIDEVFRVSPNKYVITSRLIIARVKKDTPGIVELRHNNWSYNRDVNIREGITSIPGFAHIKTESSPHITYVFNRKITTIKSANKK